MNSDLAMTFRLGNAARGGVALYAETRPSVDATNGASTLAHQRQIHRQITRISTEKKPHSREWPLGPPARGANFPDALFSCKAIT